MSRDREKEKPRHRRVEIGTRRPIDWSDGPLEVPKKQSWYEPAHPAMKGVS